MPDFLHKVYYENVDSDGAAKVVKDLTSNIGDESFVGSKIEGKTIFILYDNRTRQANLSNADRTVSDAGDFAYTDLDGSVSKNQVSARLARTCAGLGTPPPKEPECRSRVGPVTVISASASPRMPVQIDGVSAATSSCR